METPNSNFLNVAYAVQIFCKNKCRINYSINWQVSKVVNNLNTHNIEHHAWHNMEKLQEMIRPEAKRLLDLEIKEVNIFRARKNFSLIDKVLDKLSIVNTLPEEQQKIIYRVVLGIGFNSTTLAKDLEDFENLEITNDR